MFFESFGVPADKLFFAPYAVDNTRHAEAIRVRSSQRGAELHVRILFVGKLIEKKRPMDLLQAFHKLQRKSPDSTTELWFVGSGIQQSDLEAYVFENDLQGVTFWGFQNQTRLPHFYSNADIFVLPSGYGETWGLVVNEAMCHGKPIIVSDLVGCGADLVTESNGFRFPHKDVHRLAEYLDKLIRDSELRSHLGRESFRIIQGYSAEVSAKNIANAVIKVAGSGDNFSG